jgi:hypothetical protein
VNTREHLHRLQGRDSLSGSDCTSDEWNERRASLTQASYPANRTSEKPVRQDSGRVVHDQGVNGSKKQADKRYCYGPTNEGRHEPDDEFQSVKHKMNETNVGEIMN